MLYGELWEGHLWLHVQWIVAMVIVTLLEESVVCCLTTKHLESEDLRVEPRDAQESESNF